jgi:hypothetical protein
MVTRKPTSKAAVATNATVPHAQQLAKLVHAVRHEKVLIDTDLAQLYGVETGALNRAVKRNASRFPDDFMFQLTAQEWDDLRCQIGISSAHGGRRALPYVFTEQGVAMLSSVLNSPRAVQVNIAIMRTFVQLRQMLASDADLARKLAARERKYDARFKAVFDAIRALMEPVTAAQRREIGFHTGMSNRVPGARRGRPTTIRP